MHLDAVWSGRNEGRSLSIILGNYVLLLLGKELRFHRRSHGISLQAHGVHLVGGGVELRCLGDLNVFHPGQLNILHSGRDLRPGIVKGMRPRVARVAQFGEVEVELEEVGELLVAHR
jgi:hypothetical protein